MAPPPPPPPLQEIVDRAGCPPEAWARTLSRLCPTEGTPSDEKIGAEVAETVAGLMASDDRPDGDDEGADGHDDDDDGLWAMDDDA